MFFWVIKPKKKKKKKKKPNCSIADVPCPHSYEQGYEMKCGSPCLPFRVSVAQVQRALVLEALSVEDGIGVPCKRILRVPTGVVRGNRRAHAGRVVQVDAVAHVRARGALQAPLEPKRERLSRPTLRLGA
jgi:hypothetical protein